MSSKMYILCGLVGLGILLVLGLLFLKQPSTQSVSTQANSKSQTKLERLLKPQPTPFPFEEMTIPYLRNRSYISQLGDLNQISSTTTYTSFVTGYNSDGLNINGLLTQPKGEMPLGGWPAVVFVHGYIPPTQYRTLEKYQDYVNYLARNGFVVFKIDLRGHGSSEGEAGGAYYSADYVIDTLNARAALQALDFVNPNKIGLWGHSMAGNVVLRSMAAQPEIPAGVIWAGAVYTYTDMQEFGIDDNSYRPPSNNTQRQQKRQQMRELYGDPDANNWFWQQVIPTNYLSDLKGALQVHHAIDDAVVSIDYSRNLMTLMDQTQVPHELVEHSSGGHNLAGPAFSRAMQSTVEFYNTNL